jgi:predicted anti-sigma-YlaC factor YlaD
MNDAKEMSCAEAARLLSRQQDLALSPADETILKHHLYQCLACRRFDEQLLFLRRLASRYASGDASGMDDPI